MAAFTLAIQVLFLLFLPGSDRINRSVDFYQYYDPVAQNFLHGHGLTLNSGEFGTQYPPGFPLFLAGSYAAADALHVDRISFVIGANLVLMTLACVLVFATARRLFSPAIAVFSAFLWSTYVFNLWLIKQPNSEVPFIPLLLGAVYSMIVYFEKPQFRMVGLCGLLLGLAALIRPIVVLLPILFALVILFKKNLERQGRLVAAIVVLGVFMFSIAPWELILYSHTGHIVPLSTNGPGSIYDGLTFARRNGVSALPESVLRLMEDIEHDGPNMRTTGGIFRYLTSQAAQKPFVWTELFFIKAARCWYGTDSGLNENPILIIQVFYLILSAAGFVLLARHFQDRRPELKLFLGTVLYFWGMAVVALSILRYLVPIMAFLLIPAASVPAVLLDRVGGNKSVNSFADAHD